MRRRRGWIAHDVFFGDVPASGYRDGHREYIQPVTRGARPRIHRARRRRHERASVEREAKMLIRCRHRGPGGGPGGHHGGRFQRQVRLRRQPRLLRGPSRRGAVPIRRTRAHGPRVARARVHRRAGLGIRPARRPAEEARRRQAQPRVRGAGIRGSIRRTHRGRGAGRRGRQRQVRAVQRGYHGQAGDDGGGRDEGGRRRSRRRGPRGTTRAQQAAATPTQAARRRGAGGETRHPHEDTSVVDRGRWTHRWGRWTHGGFESRTGH